MNRRAALRALFYGAIAVPIAPALAVNALVPRQRLRPFVDGEVLTAAQLNAVFDEIMNAAIR